MYMVPVAWDHPGDREDAHEDRTTQGSRRVE